MGNSISRARTASHVTVFNFVQGRLGNCCMVAAMAGLAKNKNLYNKIVPSGQNFKSNNSSKVIFNLFKLGKLHTVEVDKKLPTDGKRLKYCRSYNGNLVGPLLEKALVQLMFDGNYSSAYAVSASLVMTSLTNSFYDNFVSSSNDSRFKFKELLDHGLKTNCQMIAVFRQPVPKVWWSTKGLRTYHCYNVVGMKNSEKDSVELYDPHGKIVSIEKEAFIDSCVRFDVSYSENKIFRMPEVNTLVNFAGNWPPLKCNEKMHFVDYDLLINEIDTEILINVIINYQIGIDAKIFIITNDDKITVVNCSVIKSRKIVHRKSLRETLKSGKYKIVVVLSTDIQRVASCAVCKEYLEKCGDKFLLRVAASKQCSVKKSVKRETDKITNTLYNFMVSVDTS